MDAIIVGAGVAGLSCALELKRKGIEFVILEASDAVGGRVRTDRVDGFLLDRGFQVFLTAYPEARRVLDYSSLDLKAFYPGALLRVNRSFKRVSDPWRRPLQASRDFLSGVIPRSDQLRIGSLRARVTSSEYRPPEKEISTLHYLEELGIGDTTIRRFLKPFFGGIFLEEELTTSQAMFEFVFKMMSSGDISIPAKGMGEIPAQMAHSLPTQSLRLNSKVVSLKNRVVELENSSQPELWF
jgi:phytoene dehydrogenase-like protein